MKLNSPESVLKPIYIGKIIKSFGFGNDSSDRQKAIGKCIVDISFGFDAGVTLILQDEDGNKQRVFLYDIEELEVI